MRLVFILVLLSSTELWAQRALPSFPRQSGEVSSDESGNQASPDAAEETANETTPQENGAGDLDEASMRRPDEIAAEAFAPPPGAVAISTKNLWIDRDSKRVFCDGYVAMREGPLEMFACPAGTKEHESVVATIAAASEVHAALLAIGATKGTPVRVIPEYLPATGQRIRVWVAYRKPDDSVECLDARRWINHSDRGTMSVDWVFAGSGVWTDPSDGVSYYQADGGDMICVSNFSTAMMDIPIESSASASDLIYRPNTPLIPSRGTPVRLILEPIAVPPAEPPTLPADDVLPMKE